jgi:hypothetical protein
MPSDARCPRTPTMVSLERNLTTLRELLPTQTLSALNIPSSLDMLYRLYGQQRSDSNTSSGTHTARLPNICQKSLSHALNVVRLTSLRESNETPDYIKALLRTAKEVRGATTWLWQAPTRAEYRINNMSFSLALCYALGIAPFVDICPFCHNQTILAGDHAHYLNCQTMRGTALTRRHNLEVRRSADIWAAAGAFVHIEPRHCRDEGHVLTNGGNCNTTTDIPDAIISPAIGPPFEIDVTFLNTAAPTYARGSPKKHLQQREVRKQERYAAHSAESGLALLPLVYSTLGGHGKEALKYAARAGMALCETVSWGEASPQEATAYVMARTAFQAVNSLGPVWREFVQRSRQAQTASRIRPPRQHRGTVRAQTNAQSSLAGRAPGQPLSYGPVSRGSDLGLS